MVPWILSTILTLSLSALPSSCDLLEINHYMPCGKIQFTQAIAWDWSPEYRRFHAQDWAMVGRWSHHAGIVTFSSPEASSRVLVRCRLFRETWTSVDPERENQELFPISERRQVF